MWIATGPFRRCAALIGILLVVGLSLLAMPRAGIVQASGHVLGPEHTIHPATIHAAATTPDCNHNGIPDSQEASWANRDDDGDGVCNGVDNCPYEANADQNPSACAMQAITVPALPGSPSMPHVTYSGATITLKGIARYGGDQFRWDFGDGSQPTFWISISDPYNLGVTHVFVGAVGQRFIATLSVRQSSNPAAVATAAYPVVIEKSSDLTDPAQLDVRAQMAVEQALWYLHINQSRSQYADGSPGYYQRYGYWDGGYISTSCVVLDALELHGSHSGGSYRTDPYVEDVQRGLGYIFANSQAVAISQQQYGNPDTNGNGIGVALGGVQASSYIGTNGECAKALADSGAPGLAAATGPPNIYSRSYADIEQDATDWFAYAQYEGGSNQGGWGYTANLLSDNDLSLWPVLAMSAAEGSMGSTVPAFVRQQLPYWLNYSQHHNLDYSNGAWGLFDPNEGFGYVGDGRTGDGLTEEAFVGRSALDTSSVVPGLGFLYRDWNDNGNANCWGANLGWSGAMYRIMTGLVGLGVSRVTEWNYITGQQTGNSFDWYYTPAAQTQSGYAPYLIQHQNADGSWADSSGCNTSGDETFASGPVLSAAFDALILLRDGRPARPSAPSSVTATLGAGAVTVNWNVPASPGSPILRYDITCTDTSNNNATGCPSGTVAVTAPATSGQVSSLTAGHTYTFTVTAFNAAGAGTVSQPSNSVTLPAPTGARVRDFRVLRAGSVLTFRWRVANSRGIAAFTLYAGHRRLNAQPVPVHTSRDYRYVTSQVSSGPYSLHVLLVNGSQVIVPARYAARAGRARMD